MRNAFHAAIIVLFLYGLLPIFENALTGFGLLSNNLAFIVQGGLVVGILAVLIYDLLSAIEVLAKRMGWFRAVIDAALIRVA